MEITPPTVSAVIPYDSWHGSLWIQVETSALECDYIFFLMLNLADTSLYCRLHHAASKASVDSSAVSSRLMRCTADTVETSYYYTHDN